MAFCRQVGHVSKVQTNVPDQWEMVCVRVICNRHSLLRLVADSYAVFSILSFEMVSVFNEKTAEKKITWMLSEKR